MTEAAIIATARTPIGTAFKGSLVDVGAYELRTRVVTEVVQRAGIDPRALDDIVLGESRYGGGDMARYVATEAGLEHVPGLAHNRHCASGLAAVTTASAGILAGMDRVVIAGGSESGSTSPRFTRRVPGTDDWADWAPPSHRDTPTAPNEDMSITVGWNAAVEADVSPRGDGRVGVPVAPARRRRDRRRQLRRRDRARSRSRARDGTTETFAVDEHPRRTSTLEKLAVAEAAAPRDRGLQHHRRQRVGHERRRRRARHRRPGAAPSRRAVEPLASSAPGPRSGVAPERTGLAPTVAIPKALDRAGLSIDDIALWEINEAFASMCVGDSELLGIDEEIVNVERQRLQPRPPGGDDRRSHGHDDVHELRRRGGGMGVAAMCAGGGMSTAVVLEVPA